MVCTGLYYTAAAALLYSGTATSAGSSALVTAVFFFGDLLRKAPLYRCCKFVSGSVSRRMNRVLVKGETAKFIMRKSRLPKRQIDARRRLIRGLRHSVDQLVGTSVLPIFLQDDLHLKFSPDALLREPNQDTSLPKKQSKFCLTRLLTIHRGHSQLGGDLSLQSRALIIWWPQSHVEHSTHRTRCVLCLRGCWEIATLLLF